MKNKVVIVNPDHGARIYITDTPDSFACQLNEELLVNPDTRLVNHLPPELWKVVDGRLVPITEDGEVNRRMMNLTTIPKITRSLQSHGYDLAEAIRIIEKINLLPEQFQMLSEDVAKVAPSVEPSIHKMHLELKHQRHLLVAIIVLVLLLGGIILYG